MALNAREVAPSCGSRTNPRMQADGAIVQVAHLRHAPLERRFRAQVERTATCWLWIGTVDRHGYGRIGAGGRHGKNLLAHRVAWELLHGPLTASVHVLHRCDTPRCVNPSHLFLGSHQANMADRDRKRRQAAGERNGRAKVTADVVLTIRLRRSVGHTYSAIARDVGLDPTTVRNICTRRIWKAVA